MALSDLAKFNEFTYSSMTEVLAQQTELFNGASEGAIQLVSNPTVGGFSEEAFFALIGGTVRRRDPYGDKDISQKNLSQDVFIKVKVGAGTPEMQFTASQFNWIKQSPELAGATIGKQLAKDTLADMLNTGVGATATVVTGTAGVTYDASANTSPENPKTTHINLNRATAKLGDRSGDVVAWVMHSGALTQLHEQGLQNGQNLFVYGTVNISRDAFGRLIVVSDIPNLSKDSKYATLGLVRGALLVEQNNDFDSNQTRSNGKENIVTSYQAEWSYNLGIKGFSWIKGQGEAPTTSALLSKANWKQVATSNKDLAGVALISAQ